MFEDRVGFLSLPKSGPPEWQFMAGELLDWALHGLLVPGGSGSAPDGSDAGGGGHSVCLPLIYNRVLGVPEALAPDSRLIP